MKSHVSLEQKQCIVCGKTYETGAILLDKQLRQSMEHHTVTGTGLCPDDEKKYNDGYIALVEADASRSSVHGGTLKPSEAYRTGNVAHLKKEVWGKVFNTEPPGVPMVFVEVGVIEKLQAMKEKKS